MIKIYWTLQTRSKPSWQFSSLKTYATVWTSCSTSSPWSENFGEPSRQRSKNHSNDLSIALVNSINITCQSYSSLLTLLIKSWNKSSDRISGVEIVKLKQSVSLISFLAEAPIDDFLLDLLEVGSRNVMNLLKLCPWIRVKHVRHPLPLNWLDRVVDSRSTSFEGLSSKLVPELIEDL